MPKMTGTEHLEAFCLLVMNGYSASEAKEILEKVKVDMEKGETE